MQWIKFCQLIVLSCLLWGCAVNVPIDAHSQNYSERPTHRAHSKVVVFVPPDSVDQAFSQRGVMAVGMLLDWQMAAGNAMAESSKNFFENYFTNVEVRHQRYLPGTCADCALAVRPTLHDISVNKLTMQSTVKLTFDIFDANGYPVLQLPVRGKSKFLTAERLGVGVISASVPVVSSLAGNRVLSNSVEDAFADAFWRLHLQMKEHTATGALARNWLPKHLRQKQAYGRYEFAAERTIMAEGCQLPQDGLRLVEQGAGELYEAYCWRQEPFLVSCNGASCAVVYPDALRTDTGLAME